jgi:putative transposase
MVMVPVMSASPEHTMTKPKGKTGLIDVKELLQRDEDFLRAALQALTQAALEAEMTETIGAAKGERTETRLADRTVR